MMWWLLTTLNPVVRKIMSFISFPVRFMEMGSLKLYKDEETVNVVKQVIKDKRCFMRPAELAQIYLLAKNAPPEGEFAEVGVFLREVQLK